MKTPLVVSALIVAATPLLAQERTSIGGYGEVHYTNPSGRNTPATVNVSRFVVFLGHQFTDRLAFRSELEVEDAKVEGGSAGGEVALEQLYVDYRFSDRATLRTGLVLVPIGIINETHEPPTFNGVERPAYAHDIVPTTWREIGVGLTGTLSDGLAYRLYVVNGLLASGFDAAEGIRGGRQEGREASFANPSLTGRLEYARPGLKIGGSFWYGGTTGGDTLLGTGSLDAPVSVLAADVRWSGGPFAVRAEAATIGVGDASAINTRYGNGVRSRINGGYVEGAVRVVPRLNAFVRQERITSNDLTTVGLTWLPAPNVAFKGDYTFANTDVLALGVGFWF